MSSFLSRYGRPMLYGIVAASGALYLWYQFSRKKQTNVDELIGLERRRRVEKLVELRDKLEQLLGSLDNFEPETPDTEDDECIVCNSAKAIIQTYPCKHRVLCRRCFVKTLQVAVNDLNLPLKCVVCRTRIQTLDRDRHEENLSIGTV
ncbi:E3 ubiquitin-protein ligase RKP-like [Orbicella faveolata]|uniref:E3 ubiquitin-protein ligase RKP-like n=1 Tax=Orbicella faveolata TaxID=48498 RepID=UPI0009E592E7|nr:E3 ubiquitin-protein ligase RKP-like [Orbicella faveolata]